MSTLVKKAKEAMKKKNYEYTIDLCLQELRMKPDNVGARKLLREAERDRHDKLGKKGGKAGAFVKGFGSIMGTVFGGITKNYDKVMMACEEYLKNAPNDVSYLLKLGHASLKAGYEETAIAVFEDVRQIDRKNIDALSSLARVYRAREEINRSATYYELLRKADPSNKEANKAVRELAALASSRKMDEAKDLGDGDFRSLIKDKGKARKLERAGRVLRSDEEIQEAIDEIKEAIESEGEGHKLFIQLGELYGKKRDYDEAVSCFRKAYELNSSDGTILNTIGDMKLKKLKAEVRALDNKIKKNPDPSLSARRKKLAVERNDFCIGEWSRRVEAYPTEHGYKYELGKYLYAGGRIDEAISQFQKAMDDPRNRRKTRNMLGQCFLKKKVYDLALKEFKKAQEGLSETEHLHKEVTYNTAKAYEKMGDPEKARKEYEKILEIDYSYKDVAKKVTSLT